MKKTILTYFGGWLDDFRSPFQPKLFNDPAEGRKKSLTDWIFWRMLFLLWFNNPAKKRTAWLEPRRGVGRVTNEQESAVEQQPVLHLYRQPEASEGRGTGMALGMAWGAPYALQGWEQHFTLPCRWGKQPCPWARSKRGIFEAGQLQSAGLYLKHSGLVAVRHWGCSWGHDVQEGLWHSHGSFCRGQMRTDRVAWNLQ